MTPEERLDAIACDVLGHPGKVVGRHVVREMNTVFRWEECSRCGQHFRDLPDRQYVSAILVNLRDPELL